MIDIHCHILPFIDDGPTDIARFKEMANIAVKSGITDIIATPHHRNEDYYNPKDKILNLVLEYQQILKHDGNPLIIHPGQELRLHRELFMNLDYEVLTVNGAGKYLLLELSNREIPDYAYETIYELRLRGIRPIIAHPERNKVFEREPNILHDLVLEGAYMQLTAGSILGKFGKKIRSFSEKLIEHKMIHFIATDAHNSSSRNLLLKEAYEYVTKAYGASYTQYYMKNAEKLLGGEIIQCEEPIIFKKRLFTIF